MAAGVFDPVIYRWRGMIEAIFGAEESDGHISELDSGRMRTERSGPDRGHGMEPQDPQQAKMDEDAWDGGGIDNQELGDNLTRTR